MKKSYITGVQKGSPLHPAAVKFSEDFLRIDDQDKKTTKLLHEFTDVTSNMVFEAERQRFMSEINKFGPWEQNKFNKFVYTKNTERFRIVVNKEFLEQKVSVKYFKLDQEFIREQEFETLDEFLTSQGWREV